MHQFRFRVLGKSLLVLSCTIALPFGVAFADDDLLGIYVGADLGASRVEASPGSLVTTRQGSYTLTDPANFNHSHSAFDATVGIRPISIVGAEASYIDFGHPNGTLGAAKADASLKGAAVFGVAYLPVPVPLLDVLFKVGLARLQNNLAGTGSFVQVGTDIAKSSLFRLDRTNTNFAVAGGLQYSLGPLAVRAQYERFEAAGGSPTLLTAGVTWTF